MRPQLNRIFLLAVLIVVLPGVVLGERLHRGSGRRLAVGAIRRVARVCGVRVEVSGAHRLAAGRSYVLAPNHTSPMDIAAVLLARPEARFLAASELFRIPLLGVAMRALGTVPIVRGDAARARDGIAELSRPQRARELVIFPEGGIAPTRAVLPFKTGAFVVAIRTGAPVVPVAISGADGVLPRRGRLKVRPGVVRVHLLPPVPTAGLCIDDRRSLAERTRAQVVAALAGAA